MNPKSYETLLLNSSYLEPEICNLFLCCNDNEPFYDERINQTSQNILEEFRHADRKRHCDMWFMFRELREEFYDAERVQNKKPYPEALTWFRLL
jgi:hypothetical protein